jgi:protease IV
MKALKVAVRILVGLLALLGLAVVLIAAGVAAVGWRYALAPKPEVPAHAMLVLDLRRGVLEQHPASLLSTSLDGRLVLRDIIDGLKAAAADPKINGVVMRIGGEHLAFAQAQELRAAVSAFGAAGKRTLLFADSFGEEGDGNANYLLATGFKEIWLQPSGEVGISGVLIEQPYLRQLLDAVGVKAQIDQRREYKGGADLFTASTMGQPQRQNLQQLADSLAGQLRAAIAEGRHLPADRARALIDSGPHMAGAALEAKLVDRTAYWSDAEKSAGSDGNIRYVFADYVARLPAAPRSARAIALITAAGEIVRGQRDVLFGEEVTSGDDFAKAVADAAADTSIAAVVLRIDSPGGSYLASDTIWHEVVTAAKIKPVVVSMGGLAASGGYFIAAPATAIVADAGSITGSIGVFSGKFVLSELWQKLGVGWGRVQAGANAAMWSPNSPFSDGQWKKFQESLDTVYQDFTGKVASGRRLGPGQVEAVAGGRIWSGEDAVKAGLVDRIGGLAEAIDLAKEKAGIPAAAPVRLVPFPPQRDPFEALAHELFGFGDSTLTHAFAALIRAGTALEPIAERLAPLADGRERELTTPALEVSH